MSKKLLITSEQFVRMVNELKAQNIKPLIPRPRVFDPFFFFDDLEHTPLLEGILRTYEPEKIVGFLEKRYGDAAIVQIIEGENGEKIFLIKTGDIDSNQEVIDRDMALCGYFPSYVTQRHGERTIQYEPNHQNNVNELVHEEDYIYHLTPSNKVSKIRDNGLCPKTNNKMFKYPGRIYFFLHEPDMDECLVLMKQFYQESLRKARSSGAKVVYTGPYTLLKIDTRRVADCDFSYDPNAYDCIYTYDNISPEAIEVVCEFKQEYIK